MRLFSESLFPNEKPICFSIPYDNGKSRWMVPRGKRDLTDMGMVVLLKSFKKYIVGKKKTNEIIHQIWDYLVEKYVVGSTVDRKTKKVIPPREIKTDPGTVRTLIAQCKALGLLYIDREKVYHFTESAQKILDLNYDCGRKSDVKEFNKIITTLLCRINFNSEYFHSPGVRIDWDFRLRPVLFIVKLLNSKALDYYLKTPEMYIVYSRAKSITDFEKVIDLILEFRKIPDLPSILKLSQIEYREMFKKVRELSFIQLLTSRKIVKKQDNKIVLNYDFPFLNIVEKQLKGYKRDSIYESSIKTIGQWGDGASSHTSKEKYLSMLWDISKGCTTLAQLDEKLGYFSFAKNLRNILNKETGLILKLGLKFKHELESLFLQPKKDLEAEKGLVGLFKEQFKFESYHTGRMKNRIAQRGNHSDVLNVFRTQKCCGIVDSKVRRSRYYTVSANDERAMLICIQDYLDLLDQLKLPYLKLSYVCFVSSGFSKTSKWLSLLTAKTGIPVSAITIADLIEISKLNLSEEYFLHVMSKGGFLTLKSFKMIV